VQNFEDSAPAPVANGVAKEEPAKVNGANGGAVQPVEAPVVVEAVKVAPVSEKLGVTMVESVPVAVVN